MDSSNLAARERLLELYVLQIRSDDIREQLDAIRFLRPWKIEELTLYSTATERALPVSEGVKQLRSFISCKPQDVNSIRLLAYYLIEGEQFAEARDVLKACVQNESSESECVGLLAKSYLREGKVSETAGALARLKQTVSPSLTYWRTCGEYWMQKEQWSHAADCLSQAIQLIPESLAITQQLGIAQGRLNDPESPATLYRATLLDRVYRQAFRLLSDEATNEKFRVGLVMDVADALLSLERWREAIYWFDQAMMLDSSNVNANAGIKLAAAHLKDADQRSEAPSLSTAKQETSLILLRRVRPEASIEDIRKTEPRRSIAGQIQFSDDSEKAGIDFQYFNGDTGNKYLLESMGGGVAVLDYDLDSWPDLYFVQGCTFPYDPANREHNNRLYRNLGDGTFQDVTRKAGLSEFRYGQGCSIGDIDNDGDPDLFVANYGENVLFVNNGDGTFRDATEIAGLRGEQWSTSCGFADFDTDGDLDLYVANYVDALRICRGADGRVATCNPQNFDAQQDVLYQNNGDGTFTDVTSVSGITASEGKGLGVVIADFDNDGLSDVYVANDGTANFLFRNQSENGRMRFHEIGMLSGVAVSGGGQAEGGMGIACADFQGDGLLDLYVSNFSNETNTFYQNLGQFVFTDVSRRSGIAGVTEPLVGFGTQAIDLDMDGLQDLIVANGHIDDFRFRGDAWKMPTKLFRNQGNLQFEDISTEAGAYFMLERLGRGVVRLDWNRDGKDDVVVVHQDAPASLLTNRTSNSGNSISLRFVGTNANRDGQGVKVETHVGSQTRYFENSTGDGFYSSNERVLKVGLGANTNAERIEVHWPKGTTQILQDVKASSLEQLVVEPKVTSN
ncbi:MAG: FG-GAP-like repeat-containing protein [Pirellulaceae bacterium]